MEFPWTALALGFRPPQCRLFREVDVYEALRVLPRAQAISVLVPCLQTDIKFLQCSDRIPAQKLAH